MCCHLVLIFHLSCSPTSSMAWFCCWGKLWLVVEAVIAFGSGVAGLSVLFPHAHSTHDLPFTPFPPRLGTLARVCSPSSHRVLFVFPISYASACLGIGLHLPHVEVGSVSSRTLHHAGSGWFVRSSRFVVHPHAGTMSVVHLHAQVESCDLWLLLRFGTSLSRTSCYVSPHCW